MNLFNDQVARPSLIVAGQSALASDRPTGGQNNHSYMAENNMFPLPVLWRFSNTHPVDMANKNSLNRA